MFFDRTAQDAKKSTIYCLHDRADQLLSDVLRYIPWSVQLLVSPPVPRDVLKVHTILCAVFGVPVPCVVLIAT